MKHIAWVLCGGLALGACGLAPAQESQNQAQKLPAIRKVEIGKNAALLVNGKPFFPLMLWLQSPSDFALEKELNVNTIVGYDWDAPEGDAARTRDPGLAAYAEKAWQANLYFVPSFRADYPAGTVARAAALENVLGWIQGDEPDMSTRVSGAVVTTGQEHERQPQHAFLPHRGRRHGQLDRPRADGGRGVHHPPQGPRNGAEPGHLADPLQGAGGRQGRASSPATARSCSRPPSRTRTASRSST